MARKTLSDLGVRALKPRAARFAFPDPELSGHYVRVQPNGAKAYCAVARNPSGKQIWTTIGATDVLPIADARMRAREAIQRVRDGLPAVEAKAETFATVAANWLKRHVDAKAVVNAPKIKYLLTKHVLPRWKDREAASIRKSDIAALLDHVEDNHSTSTADSVLEVVRSILNWHATRTDDFNPPFSRGMKRGEKASRERMLDDDELRLVWQAAESSTSVFGAIVRMCLLTSQRSRCVASMKWSDLEDGVWSIPREPRAKETGGDLALPEAALAIIEARPRLTSNPYVFAGYGGGPFRGWSSRKSAFDGKLPAGMAQWQLHDLRRTARSLMSRAGVSSEHAERVMGHSIGGVEKIYDRHKYAAEKAAALKKLAALIDAIVHERTADVLPMKRRQRTASL